MAQSQTKAFKALAADLNIDHRFVSATYEGISFDMQGQRLKAAALALIPAVAPALINALTTTAFQFSPQIAPFVAIAVPVEFLTSVAGIGIMTWNMARHSISERHIYQERLDRAFFKAATRLLKKEQKIAAKPDFGSKKPQNPVLTPS